MKPSSLILTSLCLAVTGITILKTLTSSEKKHNKEFSQFKATFGKLYSSPSESDFRYSVFADQMEFINSHNNSNSSFELGVNQFSDLTWEEFQNKYLF